MKILGIDPGTAITGFGVIKAGVKTEMIDAGVVRTPANQPLAERLQTIYKELTQLIGEYRPDQIAVEELYFAANVTTAISVSHARGVVMLCAAEAQVSNIGEYTPLQIKQALTGYGRAEKHQIQEMVRLVLNLNQPPKPDDAADALAVAICHSQTMEA